MKTESENKEEEKIAVMIEKWRNDKSMTSYRIAANIIEASLKTEESKALAILKAFHDLAHDSEKNEGVIITKDWDLNTLTIMCKGSDGKMIHSHFGQMNCENEKGFSILIDDLYKTFAKK